MANSNLTTAKNAKNDEFYTQYSDIQREINAYIAFDPDLFRDKTVLLPCDDPEWSNFTKFFAQNFENYGIRKLISTSYAIESKKYQTDWQPTLFETTDPRYNADRSKRCGKIFTLTRDTNGNGRIDIDDLEWQYMNGDGDFRSAEVCALRDEADIIVTNPPFSLFREFVAWLNDADKRFIIIGNMNAITYKEIFPLIKNNRLWLGVSNGAREYMRPDGSMQKMGNTCWFTNVEHGRRHSPLPLMTMEDNIRFSRHKEIRDVGYLRYDNYDAIEVPYTDAIPSDYTECIGVPISFLDKYCPFQYRIIGATESEGRGFSAGLWNPESGISQAMVRGNKVFKRLFIQVVEEEEKRREEKRREEKRREEKRREEKR